MRAEKPRSGATARGDCRRRASLARTSLASLLAVLALAACASGDRDRPGATQAATTAVTLPTSTGHARDRHHPGPQRPAVNIYAPTHAGDLSPVVRHDPALVYVPNSISDTVDVISQRTFKIVRQFPTGALPQHVTPSYDLKTLYVDNDVGNSLTPINPRPAAPAADPRRGPLQPLLHARRSLRDRRRRTPAAAGLPQPDHDAARALAVRAPMPRRRSHGLLRQRALRVRELRVLRPHDRGRPAHPARDPHASCSRRRIASPQDVKLSPDGRTLYVADQLNGGLWEINPSASA